VPLILAYRNLGLGDLLVGVPALRAIRRTHPGATLALAQPPGLADLAARAADVDLSVDPERCGALPRADLVVNLHGRGPASTRLLSELRPRRLVAFGLGGAPTWRSREHDRERWCRLVAGAEVADPDDVDPLDLRIEPVPGSEPSRPGATVVHPGASSPARRWPARRWSAVARAELDEGRPVVLVGSAGERARCQQIADLTGEATGGLRAENLAGRTDPVGLLGLVASSSRVVAGDSGVAHLATAARTPSVLLFGPVSPQEWGPPPAGPHRVLWKGRLGDPHGAAPDTGLLEISVEEVLEALRSLVDAGARRVGRGPMEQRRVPGQDPGLTIEEHDDTGRSVLDVAGEIDEWTCSRLLVAVRRALARSGDVALDLSGVTFIGSAGLSALLQLHAFADRQRQRFEVVRVSPTVRRAVELARLGDILPIGAGGPDDKGVDAPLV
jgi:anti-anti-sigma factor